MEDKIIVALEIGSSKIKGAIGSVDKSGNLSVKAIEEEPLVDSVRYGLIRNVVETAEAISKVVERLEAREPGRKVEGVYISMGGRSLRSELVVLEHRLPAESDITAAMVEDLSREAFEQPVGDRKIIDVTPREFRVDNVPTNRPVGTYGTQLLAKLNIISLRNHIYRNLMHVIQDRLNLKICGYFVRQIVEGDLVLSTEEKRLGCALIDFGAETTTISVYKHGVLQYLDTLPLGSRNITRDITALNHLEERAEELKIRGGNALPSAADQQTSMFAHDEPDFTEINNYVSARAGEIIANIAERIKASGFNADLLPAGIVIIGRGARLTNFNQRLGADLGMKVRAGQPGARIRVTDSRILPSDNIDVIATLAAAAESAEQCMPLIKKPTDFFVESTPEVTETPEEEKKEETPVTKEPEKPAESEKEPEKPEKKPGNRFWKSLVNKIAQIVTEEPREDDDEDDEEDEK
ncbi:MAG: hypothetical protein NC098_00560 [Lachnoclostridium sp.]|nr:hypothetical protein [Lachnoclostridium sp.]